MAGNLSIDGLISGLDTTDLINQLMEVERIPITQLEARKAGYNQKISLWQAANTKLLALLTSAGSLTSASTFQAKKVEVSNSDILSATASSSAVSGSYQLRVERLAYAHQMATTSTYADYDTATFGEGTITLQVGEGDEVEIAIDSSNNTLEGIKNAINQADAGVQASIVKVSGGYKLLLASETTGEAGEISITSALTGGGATLSSFDTIQPAQNARIVLGSGSSALVYESSSNVITDFLPGVTLNLKAVSTEVVTLKVDKDLEGIKNSILDLVRRYNDFSQFVKDNTFYDADTKEGGALLGDTTLSRIMSGINGKLFGSVSSPNEKYDSLVALGILIDRYGQISVDEEKLSKALEDDLGAVENVFRGDKGVAVALKGYLDFVTDPREGTLKDTQDLYKNLIKDIDERIEVMEERLEKQAERLRTQFTAMESALSLLQTQATWLSQQITALSSFNYYQGK